MQLVQCSVHLILWPRLLVSRGKGAARAYLHNPLFLVTGERIFFSDPRCCLARLLPFFENFTLELLKGADSLREWLVSQSTSPKMEIIARLILHESAILVVGFTIAARIVLGAIIMFFAWLITGRADHIT